jgi:dTDP-glucose 4,6-dehydratase
MTEDHPLQGQSPYAASKVGADQIALSFHRAFGTPVSVIRPFNTFGPRQSARAVIPTVITQILSGAKRVKLGALHPTRDFTYVDDTVAAFIAMAKAKHVAGETVNVGSDFEISIGDLAAMIADIMGAKVELVADDKRFRPAASEVERLWADASKARKLLDWRPKASGQIGLRRGLEKTVKWFSDPLVL